MKGNGGGDVDVEQQKEALAKYYDPTVVLPSKIHRRQIFLHDVITLVALSRRTSAIIIVVIVRPGISV
jgi:hypothetical protein